MAWIRIRGSVCCRIAKVVGTGAAAILSSPVMAAEAPSIFSQVQVEEAEYRYTDDTQSFNWDGQGWIGGDVNKLVLKTKGELVIDEDRLEEAEVQALYGRQISNFFDAEVGLRYDVKPQPARAFGVLGLQGLAPYLFELDAATFVSDEGEVSARFEAEYEILVTQRIVLQPKFETNVAVQKVSERGVGSGLNDIELGLRLRYEFVREFAPYIGVSWEKAFGETADLLEDEGEDDDNLAGVAGIRFWF